MVDKANFDCYSCIYRESVPGDAHSACRNSNAKVAANPHGIKMGWFMWPWNFDPVWLTSCNGYKRRTELCMHENRKRDTSAAADDCMIDHDHDLEDFICNDCGYGT